MDPNVEALLEQMPEDGRAALASDMAGWANHHGVELTDDLAEQFVREAFAADHDGAAVEDIPEPPPGLTDPARFFAGYGQQALENRAEEFAEDIMVAVSEEVADVERRIGRPLRMAERTAMDERLTRDLRLTGVRPDAAAIQEAADAVGIRGYGEMNRQEQAAAMAERAADLRGPTPDVEVPVTFGSDGDRAVDFSQMSRDQANAYMAARLAGGQLEEEGG